MEVVDHQAGMRQALGQSSGIAGVGVDHRGGDAGEPRFGLGAQPLRDRSSAATGHDVYEAVAVQVHEPGDQQRGMGGVGGQERRLVDADRSGHA